VKIIGRDVGLVVSTFRCSIPSNVGELVPQQLALWRPASSTRWLDAPCSVPSRLQTINLLWGRARPKLEFRRN